LAPRTITDALLRAIKPPATGRLEIADTKVAGLVVRVTQTGAISYSFRKMLRGRHLRMTVGQWPMGIADARKLAMAALVEFQKGGDPVAERRAKTAPPVASAPLPTVKQRLDEWQNLRDKDWSFKHAREVARIVRHDILPMLGDRSLSLTTRDDWVTLVTATRARSPAMAAAIYRIISAFTNFAEAAGWIEVAPLPRRGAAVLAPPPKSRDRVLTDDELVKVWHGADHLGVRGRALVRLLILTGARLREVARLRPSEIDVALAIWKLPATRAKNNRAYTIRLCPLALSELDACQCKPITGAFSELKRALDETSGVTGWVLHDLRRTVRTGLSRLGTPREVAEAAVNHVGARSGLVGVYDRHDYADEILAALQRWQSHVAALVA
jgi:integrase